MCDGKDNDCNNIIDDIQPEACYSGPSDTEGVGICKGGTRTCTGGRWSACTGEATPMEEICDGKDNDCDGQKDEGCCGYLIHERVYLICQCDYAGQYDFTPFTIRAKGCALASLIMLMNSQGCNADFLTVNQCISCFDDGNVHWPNITAEYCPANLISYYGKAACPSDPLILKLKMQEGYRYIMEVPGRRSRQHFVLVGGIKQDCRTILAFDPGQSADIKDMPNEEYDISVCKSLRVFKIK